MKSKVPHAVLTTCLVAAGFAANAFAATSPVTADFTVSLTVNRTCNVTTSAASDITLGSVDAGGTSTSSSGSFSVNCSKLTPFYIGLAPQNVASTTGAGTLSGVVGNTDAVAYQLYSNAGLTTPWGNTATSTDLGNGVSGVGNGMGGAAITETVYANATGSTDVKPDTYTDTVQINVNF